MRLRYVISLIVAVVVLNVIAHFFSFRRDMTEDRRYSLSAPTQELLSSLKGEITVECFLNGDVNASFRRLHKATKEMIEEMHRFADVRFVNFDKDKGELPASLSPIVVHERERDGKMSQIPVYPYLRIRKGEKSCIVPLLQNNRAISGAENINRSIECLEYALVDGVKRVLQKNIDRVAFIEGHGEIEEPAVIDWVDALGQYFSVDRGTIGNDGDDLTPYKTLIVAGPHEPFKENEKYLLDQYLMNGGRILWLLDGVRRSDEQLARDGTTPFIANDINLNDMLFRYGVKIPNVIVEDLQCLTVPVDVSKTAGQTNFQPLPCYAYPLLLTSNLSPITRGLAQVSAQFVSPVEIVGAEDEPDKQILLATSTRSRIKATPALFRIAPEDDLSTFKYAYIPVAVCLEGEFNSFYAHRLPPPEVKENDKKNKSVRTKQIVIGSGSIARNRWADGKPLPVGYDPYSNIRFGNRDFLVNCVQYLCDDTGLLELRNKNIRLRMLNEERSHRLAKKISRATAGTPLIVLIILSMTVRKIRKNKYVISNANK